MQDKKYRNIILYQSMIEVLKSWLKSGKISRRDYTRMNTKLADKYEISLSGILVDLSEK